MVAIPRLRRVASAGCRRGLGLRNRIAALGLRLFAQQGGGPRRLGPAVESGLGQGTVSAALANSRIGCFQLPGRPVRVVPPRKLLRRTAQA